ncbi:hypothetical protein ABPG72_006298 [Tetrahymena utriculariae]
MHSVNINQAVFDRITQDRPQKVGRLQKWINYISWSRESEESKKLGNLTFVLVIIIIISILNGVLKSNIQMTINGIHNCLHLFSFIFSMYALMKAKKNANMHYTYGYTRYETIAAFSNCIFLILSSLFLVISSLHYLTHDEDHSSSTAQTVTDGEKAHTEGSQHEDESGPLIIFYVKIIFNLVGIYSFSEYALFAPLEEFQDIGASTQKYAYTGVNESTYKNYSFKYEKFYRYLSQNSHHFTDESHPKPLTAHPHSSKLHFTSHYENMHSIFLHFFIDFLFNFSTLACHYLMNLDFHEAAILLPLIIMIITIIFTKKLLVITFKILLQALPIDDEINVKQMIQEITSINGVVEVPKQHFWGMTAGYLVCNITVKIRKSSNSEEIYQAIHTILSKKFYSICIQIEESKTEY